MADPDQSTTTNDEPRDDAAHHRSAAFDGAIEKALDGAAEAPSGDADAPSEDDGGESKDTLGGVMLAWLDRFNDGEHTDGRGRWNAACVSWGWLVGLLESEGVHPNARVTLMQSCHAQTRHMHGTTIELPRDWMTSGQFVLDEKNCRARPAGPAYDDSPTNWFAVEVLASHVSAWMVRNVKPEEANAEVWLSQRYLPFDPSVAQSEASPPTADPGDTGKRYAHLSREQLVELCDAEQDARQELEQELASLRRQLEGESPRAAREDYAYAHDVAKMSFNALHAALGRSQSLNEKLVEGVLGAADSQDKKVATWIEALSGPLTTGIEQLGRYMATRAEADADAAADDDDDPED